MSGKERYTARLNNVWVNGGTGGRGGAGGGRNQVDLGPNVSKTQHAKVCGMRLKLRLDADLVAVKC